mgnify:CR=1 FL=1
MKTLLALSVAIACSLVTDASAQFGPWTQSPSRPDVWFAAHPLGNHNWVSGRAEIERRHPGLAFEYCSITTQDEADLVRLLGAASLGNGIWIGITDFFHETEWVWMDGTPVTYTEWAPNQPNNDPTMAGTDQDFGYMQSSGWYISNANGSGPQDAVCAIHSADCDGNLVPDVLELWNETAIDQNENGVIDSCEEIGTMYCMPTVNSSGQSATIRAGGSPVRLDNNLYLTAWDLPLGSPGYFLASTTQDFVPMFAGSPANLCLGAPIVRLAFLPGGVLNSGATGNVILPLDLAIANGGAPMNAGENWNFQYWSRDLFTTTTTDAVSVTLQ